MNALSKFLSAENEPLRRYIYGVLVAVLALLGAVGLITASLATAIAGVLVAALVVPAVEVARSRVTPVPVPGDETGDVN